MRITSDHYNSTPPPGGLASAVRRGRALRLRRRLTVAGTGGALLAAVATAMTMGTGGLTSTLTENPAAPSIISSSPAPQAPVSATATVSRASSDGNRPPVAARASISSPPLPPVDATATLLAWHRPVTRDPAGTLLGPCAAGSDWCGNAYSKGQVTGKQRAYLGLAVCHSIPALRGNRLSFPTQQELEVVVSRGGKEMWRWSDGADLDRAPHALTVAEGECLRWRTTWNGTTSEGRPLPPGEYGVEVRLTADLTPAVTARTTTRIA